MAVTVVLRLRPARSIFLIVLLVFMSLPHELKARRGFCLAVIVQLMPGTFGNGCWRVFAMYCHVSIFRLGTHPRRRCGRNMRLALAHQHS
ncbi:hypothetical protein ACI7BZ_06565 [Xanthobacter sp. AM11]|uniref:hypothetical protein n=1 Tax=Xanthobacter sp. AM11 TaxID=3380643 RepID=UPI0039BF0867